MCLCISVGEGPIEGSDIQAAFSSRYEIEPGFMYGLVSGRGVINKSLGNTLHQDNPVNVTGAFIDIINFIESADVKQWVMVNLIYQWTTKTLKQPESHFTVQIKINCLAQNNMGIYLQGSVQVSLIRGRSCDLEEVVAIGTRSVCRDRSINSTVVRHVRMIKHL